MSLPDRIGSLHSYAQTRWHDGRLRRAGCDRHGRRRSRRAGFRGAGPGGRVWPVLPTGGTERGDRGRPLVHCFLSGVVALGVTMLAADYLNNRGANLRAVGAGSQ